MKILSIVLILSVSIIGCTKRDYYNDGGLASESEADKQMLLYDYLKSKPGIFDSIVKMIDLSDSRDLINQENITFFAPTNLSVILMQADAMGTSYSPSKPEVKSLTEISPSTLELIVKRFIIPGHRLKLKEVYEDGAVDYISAGGDSVNISAYRGYFQGTAGNGAMLMEYKHYHTEVDKNTNDYLTDIQTHDLVTKNAMLQVIKATSSYGCGYFK